MIFIGLYNSKSGISKSNFSKIGKKLEAKSLKSDRL